MYLIIKREKTDHLKSKARKMKELACEVIECLEEAYEEAQENERDYDRRSHDLGDDDEDYRSRKYRDDYDDDDDMEERRRKKRKHRGRY